MARSRDRVEAMDCNDAQPDSRPWTLVQGFAQACAALVPERIGFLRNRPLDWFDNAYYLRDQRRAGRRDPRRCAKQTDSWRAARDTIRYHEPRLTLSQSLRTEGA